jgi:hypothetical protein
MPRQLAIRTQGGFANRLRTIVSAVLWAEDLDRELLIYWPVEPGHMPCHLQELLDMKSIPRLKGVYAEKLAGAVQVLTHQDMKHIADRGNHEGLLRIESYAEFHTQQRWSRGLTVLRGIRVRGDIEAEADRLWADLGGKSSWLGVHYRGTDHKKCIEASPLEVFFPTLSHADSGIFVCTDEPEVKETLKSLYTVHSLDIQYGRKTANQQCQAVIEWLLLHKCSRVIQSAGSSFSELATLRSGGILIRAQENMAIPNNSFGVGA